MSSKRKKFYFYLLTFFPLFFLLHWNGFLDPVYYWALHAYGDLRNPYSQMIFAFLSSVAIFSSIAILYELIRAGLRLLNS